eukprot:gene16337-17974_t
MNTRRGDRINYKALSETGKRVVNTTDRQQKHQNKSLEVDEGTSPLINNEITNPINAAQINDTSSTLIAEIRVAIDEARDVINEHLIHDASLDDTKEIIQLLTKYRLDIRKRSATLMTIASDRHTLIESNVTNILNLIKDFIKTANDIKAKSNLRTSQLEEDKFENELKSTLFTAEDIISHPTQLQSIFETDQSSCDDQYLLQLKSEIPEREKTLHTIADRYERLLKFPLCNSKLSTLFENIGVQYSKIKSRKAEFTSSVHAVIEKREVLKHKSFNEMKLNIDLKKFSGYDSAIDIYSFKSNFEKLHLRNTPKKLLADLLTNNYLSDPALSLVKGVSEIDVIWDRLKQAYGNSKILLTKKLSQLLGDGRTTCWFSSICDEELDEKQKWTKLITFLEKEVRIQQQKALLTNSRDEKEKANHPGKNPNYLKNPRPKGGNNAHYTPLPEVNQQSNTQQPPPCYFCDRNCQHHHVPTRGPGVTMVIQYFACKDFADKSPAERFITLKRKGLCFQCLLPGAKQQDSKHKDGRCQRDFACKHPSHQQYNVKRHVLVCEDHKTSQENVQLLAEFKSRFINKNQSLPSF